MTALRLAAVEETPWPQFLGRYRITARLGGGFGVVYKGHDEELHRDVAIKVPHKERISRPEDGQAYLDEARIVAGLDHSHAELRDPSVEAAGGGGVGIDGASEGRAGGVDSAGAVAGVGGV